MAGWRLCVVERTGERGGPGARAAAVPAAHALGLALARLDAVLLHAERPVHLQRAGGERTVSACHAPGNSS